MFTIFAIIIDMYLYKYISAHEMKTPEVFFLLLTITFWKTILHGSSRVYVNAPRALSMISSATPTPWQLIPCCWKVNSAKQPYFKSTLWSSVSSWHPASSHLEMSFNCWNAKMFVYKPAINRCTLRLEGKNQESTWCISSILLLLLTVIMRVDQPPKPR